MQLQLEVDYLCASASQVDTQVREWQGRVSHGHSAPPVTHFDRHLGGAEDLLGFTESVL